MDEQELNRKLAEWAGFKVEPTIYHNQATGKDKLGFFVTRPDNTTFNSLEIAMYSLPDFAQSLDACFKWLVPKLEAVKIILNEAPSGDVFWNGTANSETVTSETPALALCLAIEKLISKE